MKRKIRKISDRRAWPEFDRLIDGGNAGLLPNVVLHTMMMVLPPSFGEAATIGGSKGKMLKTLLSVAAGRRDGEKQAEHFYSIIESVYNAVLLGRVMNDEQAAAAIHVMAMTPSSDEPVSGSADGAQGGDGTHGIEGVESAYVKLGNFSTQELITEMAQRGTQSDDAIDEAIKGLEAIKDAMGHAESEAEKGNSDSKALIAAVGRKGHYQLDNGSWVPNIFKHMLALAKARLNIFLTGPTGCGKTHLCGVLADELNLEFSSISCSIGMSEAMLTGWLLPTGEGGAFEYVASEFINRYENGGVFLFDEIDSADPNTMTFIHQALAQDGFYVSQRHHAPFVKRHPDFICVAAANTFGTGADVQYVGRNQLDLATLDRFAAGMVSVDYNRSLETQLGNPEVVTWAHKVRDYLEETQAQRVMSMRTILEFSKLSDSVGGLNEKQLDRAYLAPWSKDEVSALKEWRKAQVN